MEEASFEISIEKEDSGKIVDKNNLSIKASQSFNSFLESLTEIAKSQTGDSASTIDLGTNKVAIKSSKENIDKLKKSITEFSENKLSKNNKVYKALVAIENVISANGLTYSTIIKINNSKSDVTSIFEKSKNLETKQEELVESPKELLGLKFYTGKIKSIDIEKSPNLIKFVTNRNESIQLICSPRQIYSLATSLANGNELNISCYSNKNSRGKVVNTFFDDYSSEEFEPFSSFYYQIDSFEGTEKLKNIYRFFNQYIVKNELNRVVKFARVFLIEDTDISIQRILIDVLKKVNDQEVIFDTWNELIESLSKKIGGIN